MLVKRWWWAVRAARNLRGYQPRRVTFGLLLRWSKQFPREARGEILRLAANLEMVSEQEAIDALMALNGRVIEALRTDGVTQNNVIYITTDTAGSSSGAMLDLLRRWANLERKGASFLHAGEGEKIQRRTMELGIGAIIYVDDFAGTGRQFARTRRRVAEYITGGFSEFLLVPCICEEALQRCHEMGVQAEAQIVHFRRDRPFHKESKFLSTGTRLQLLRMCQNHFGGGKRSLGFAGMATNVVLYRNAPNTTPLLFRGNLGQSPLYGIVPRFDDLELPVV